MSKTTAYILFTGASCLLLHCCMDATTDILTRGSGAAGLRSVQSPCWKVRERVKVRAREAALSPKQVR